MTRQQSPGDVAINASQRECAGGSIVCKQNKASAKHEPTQAPEETACGVKKQRKSAD
jgi:hypothetical protein